MQSTHEETIVLIPAHNEAESLPWLLKRINNVGEIVVINNASTDSTVEVAREHGATVIHESRLGYGTAVLSGLAYARLKKYQFAIILDADGSNNPESIPELIQPLIDDSHDLVLAQRTHYAEEGALLSHQKFGNWLAVNLMQIICGYKYSDMGPFRAIRLSTLPSLSLRDPNFGWNIEMQMRAVQNNLRILEIDLPYFNRRHGKSKISGNLRASVTAGIIILRSVWIYR